MRAECTRLECKNENMVEALRQIRAMEEKSNKKN
jgi:hypothetical protein